jgi:hypothetical protein
VGGKRVARDYNLGGTDVVEPVGIFHKTVAGAEEARDAHEGFQKLERSLAHEKGVTDPAALAASIGRKKYGAAGMAAKSAAGRVKDDDEFCRHTWRRSGEGQRRQWLSLGNADPSWAREPDITKLPQADREAVEYEMNYGSASAHGKAKDSEEFGQGDKVRTDVTPKIGTILGVEGSGDMAKVLVRFGEPDKYGVSDVRKLYAYLLRKSATDCAEVMPVGDARAKDSYESDNYITKKVKVPITY